MTVADYVKARDFSKAEAYTIEHAVRKAILAGEDAIADASGYINPDALKDPTKRSAYLTGMKSGLEKLLDAKFPVGPGLSQEEKDARLSDRMTAYFGFDNASLQQAIEEGKENLTYDSFWKALVKPMQSTFQRRAMSAFTKLQPTDGNDVVMYTKSIGAIDPIKLTDPRDMAQLIETYNELQVIPPKMLEGKPYKR